MQVLERPRFAGGKSEAREVVWPWGAQPWQVGRPVLPAPAPKLLLLAALQAMGASSSKTWSPPKSGAQAGFEGALVTLVWLWLSLGAGEQSRESSRGRGSPGWAPASAHSWLTFRSATIPKRRGPTEEWGEEGAESTSPALWNQLSPSWSTQGLPWV